MVLGTEERDEGHDIDENLETRKGEDLRNRWINTVTFILH